MEAKLDKYLQVVTSVTPKSCDRERIHPEELELFFEVCSTLNRYAERTFENIYRHREDWKQDLWDAAYPLDYLTFDDINMVAHCSVAKWDDTKSVVFTVPRDVIPMTSKEQRAWAVEESNKEMQRREQLAAYGTACAQNEEPKGRRSPFS